MRILTGYMGNYLMANYFKFDEVRKISVIGTGTIGASWATYFLAQGYEVNAWDPSEGWEDRLAAFIENAWPYMETMGLAINANKKLLSCGLSLVDAVNDAQFVQENAPENMKLKRDLYRKLDDIIPQKTILASSTSGLIMTDLQNGFESAGRFVVGHPFNPPHLIPLVEIVAGLQTDPAAIDWALGFYKHIGKHPILVKKEVPGHLANRLQAALWREAVLAVKNNLASVEDVNAAVAQGPGLRWALMGPHMIMNLTGGKGGFQKMIEHFGPGIETWWETMTENPKLSEELTESLMKGINDEVGSRSIEDLEKERDQRLIGLLKLLRSTESC